MQEVVAGGTRSKGDLVNEALTSFVWSAGLGVGLQFFPGAAQPEQNLFAMPRCQSDADCDTRTTCRRDRVCRSGTTNAIVSPCLSDLFGAPMPCPGGGTCVDANRCALSLGLCDTSGQLCPGGMPGDVCQTAPARCLFPPGGLACAPSVYENPTVPIGALPAAEAPLVQALQRVPFRGGTPMGPALTGALAQARKHQAANPTHRVALVLATDGVPESCEPADVAGVSALAASAAMQTPPISTYAIGVFGRDGLVPGRALLDSVATAGGTGTPFVLNSDPDLARTFLEALEKIRGATLPCQFLIPRPNAPIDFGKVNVHVQDAAGTGQDIPHVTSAGRCDPVQGGWYYDVDPAMAAPTRVLTCPATCRRLQADAASTVSLVFGCKTRVIELPPRVQRALMPARREKRRTPDSELVCSSHDHLDDRDHGRLAGQRRLGAAAGPQPLHDGDQADDLVQETWIAALRAKPSREQPLRPWLGRVLRNRAANRSRDDARREARHRRASILVAGAAGADPEELVSRIQAQRLLADLITNLREPNRQTVLLRYYEGFTSEQIGSVMGVPAGTVRRRLKDALDHLRDQLDRRHQGNREAWLGALLPLARVEPPPSAPTTEVADPSSTARGPAPPAIASPVKGSPAPPSPLLAAGQSGLSSRRWLGSGLPVFKVAIGALVAALGAGGALLWLSSPGAPPSGRGGPAALGTPGNPPGGGGQSFAAVLPANLDACRDLLAARRKELAETELRYRQVMKPSALFEEGVPNPAARAALLPELERILRADAGSGHGFTLECRTWVCRLLVLFPAQLGFREPERRTHEIARDPIFKERLYSWSPGVTSPVTDSVSNADYRETQLFLVLKAPSGARVPGVTLPTDAMDQPQPPLPATVPACRSELEAADRRLAQIRPVVERDEQPQHIYVRSSPNPSLTREFQALVARALPPTAGAAGPQVECRASVCRVQLPGRKTNDPEDPWVRQLENDPGVLGKIGRKGFFPDFMLYEFGPGARPPVAPAMAPTTSEGRSKAASPMVTMLNAVDVAGCAKRFPATGTMKVVVAFTPWGSTAADGSIDSRSSSRVRWRTRRSAGACGRGWRSRRGRLPSRRTSAATSAGSSIFH